MKMHKLPLKLSMHELPLKTTILSTNHLAMSSNILIFHFVPLFLSPFGNELIKQQTERIEDSMHEIKIRVLHKLYKGTYLHYASSKYYNS